MELLAEKPEKFLTKGPVVTLKNDSLSLELENVSFKYAGDARIILKNLSLKIPAGETWALVGQSQSYKISSF